MFCFQCEQTSHGKACQTVGVCGKSPETSDLQDLLLHSVKGVARYANAVVQGGGPIFEDVMDFILGASFATVTNVNFDDSRFVSLLQQSQELLSKIKNQYEKMGKKENLELSPKIPPRGNRDDYLAVAKQVGVMNPESLNLDIRSARELLTYGLKGIAVYSHHAREYGKIDSGTDRAILEAFSATTDDQTTLEQYVALNMKIGGANLKVMEILQEGAVARFGAPEPTKVQTGVRKGWGILVSGHNLLDLEALLKQTEDMGISIYTHGEMLTAHSYPGLKKYKHFAGNYGGAWQDQCGEFDAFPGAILMTTNCLQKPRDTYIKRIFTTSLVGWPGVAHIENRDFSKVISSAISYKGFPADAPEKEITVGFSHQAVLKVAGAVVDAVKNKAIRHFFLVGGCDGARPGRNYYTEFAQKVPNDCVILTLACGKYRFNKLDFGDIGGIPRLLDVGQCNDANSAVNIALALANAFNCGVNDLPLSLVLSWYEQKAVVILLSLLHLGMKNIRLGPSLPAFVSPNILSFLVKTFSIMPISTPEADLNAILSPSISQQKSIN